MGESFGLSSTYHIVTKEKVVKKKSVSRLLHTQAREPVLYNSAFCLLSDLIVSDKLVKSPRKTQSKPPLKLCFMKK